MRRLASFLVRPGTVATLAAATLLTLSGCGKAGRDHAREQIKQSNHSFTADEFVNAAANGDQGLVEAFLRGGMDRNTVNSKGITPLMAAAIAGKQEVLKTLLDENANPNFQDSGGNTALLLAAAANQPESVRTLVEANADVRVRNKENLTPLLKAARSRYQGVIDVLLATSKDQLLRDGQLDRALMAAAVLGDGKMLGALLDHGAKVNAKIEEGKTALMFAATVGNREIMEALLARGADPKLVDKKGASASVIALQNGHPDLAKLVDNRTPGGPAPATTPPPAASPASTAAAVAANDGAPAGENATPPPPLSPEDAASVARERAWLKQNGVDPVAVLKKDTGQDDDHDGFTNDEELAAGTNPDDPKSFPPLYTKLRLRRVTGEAFPVVFDSFNPKNGKIEVTLRNGREDAGHAAELVVGDRLPGLPYKVGSVRARKGYEKDTGRQLDLSELTLIHAETNRKIVLRRGMDSNSPDATAVMILKLDGSEVSVHQGQQFSLPRDPATKFEVIDIRPTQVVLRIVGNGQTVTVEKDEG